MAKHKTEYFISDLLPNGKENAVSTQELLKLTGIKSARELQQRIAYERSRGKIICSGSGSGYWKPANLQEVEDFCRVLTLRARNTLIATRYAKRLLKKIKGRNSRTAFNFLTRGERIRHARESEVRGSVSDYN